MSNKIIIHGNPLSQPARAVYWLVLINELPNEYIMVDIARGQQRKPDNPTRKVPCIEDNGFIVYESHVILRYLAEKYDKSSNWYPKDLQKRVKVDMYLDWHHTNTRVGAAPTVFNTLFGPKIPGYKVPPPERIKEFAGILQRSLKFIDQEFLKDRKYINGSDCPTIADLACYSELASLFMIKYNFDAYPNIKEWMDKMKSLPHYDKVHAGMNKFISKL